MQMGVLLPVLKNSHQVLSSLEYLMIMKHLHLFHGTRLNQNVDLIIQSVRSQNITTKNPGKLTSTTLILEYIYILCISKTICNITLVLYCILTQQPPLGRFGHGPCESCKLISKNIYK